MGLGEVVREEEERTKACMQGSSPSRVVLGEDRERGNSLANTKCRFLSSIAILILLSPDC